MNIAKNSGLFFLAMGVALSGYFISQTIYNAKVALNTAEVKGLAEKRVKSDKANWEITFTNVGKSKKDIPELYQLSEKHQGVIIEQLKQNGFADNEIKLGVLNYYYQEYRDENQKLVDQKHSLVGRIGIETEKVDLVDKARSNINQLIAKGIDIENKQPKYHFTKLNEIKPAMLSEATKNARIAANEFAQNAAVKVGGIRSAKQGSFRIVDAGESYGDTKRIEKDVRVVTNISFYLTD